MMSPPRIPFKKRRLATACLTGLMVAGPATAVEVVNPVSLFEITVDGQFTDGTSGGLTPLAEGSDLPPNAGPGEWLDVTPVGYILDLDNDTSTPAADPNDPLVNALTYAAVAPGSVIGGPEGPVETLLDPLEVPDLYLLYDSHVNTDPGLIGVGDPLGEIIFPINVPVDAYGDFTMSLGGAVDLDSALINVRLVGSSDEYGGTAIKDSDGVDTGAFFDVFVDIGFDAAGPAGPFDIFDLSPADFEALGIELGAMAGFGPSPHKAEDHLIVELEIGLSLIPSLFELSGDPFEGGEPPGDDPFLCGGCLVEDLPVGGYSPAPAFWGSTFSPLTSNLISIDQNLQTTINNLAPTATTAPEPGTLALLGAGLAGFGAAGARRRRKRE